MNGGGVGEVGGGSGGLCRGGGAVGIGGRGGVGGVRCCEWGGCVGGCVGGWWWVGVCEG